MNRFLVIICCIGLVLLGAWWFFSEGSNREEGKLREEPTAINQSSGELSGVRGRLDNIGDAPSTVIVSPNVKKDKAERQERENNIAALRQWAHDLGAFALHIGKLNAIRSGRYSPQEREEIPDLHKEFAGLNTAHSTLVFPAEQLGTESAFFAVKMFADSIMENISDPPTNEELQIADGKRRELQQKANDLYILLPAGN